MSPSVFNYFKKAPQTPETAWRRHLSSEGFSLSQAGDSDKLQSEMVASYVAQLLDDGFATEANGAIYVSWDGFYDAIKVPGYADLQQVFNLPGFTQSRPSLSSFNALTDQNFEIAFGPWRGHASGQAEYVLSGPQLVLDDAIELMRPAHWQLFKEVVEFAKRRDDQRNDSWHRQMWGRIRSLAKVAEAHLDDFLHRSVVLTPDRLDIGLRKSIEIAGDSVVEIAPSFEGAPPDWLERFDRSREVLNRYDIATADGVVQVLITPQVKTVLSEIKRLPLRRVAGSRAQAFILNPYATLGEDAKDVIAEAQFERAREEAGLQYERFLPQIERDATSYPQRVGVMVESANAAGPISSEVHWLSDDQLGDFIRRLESALEREFQLLAWNGYDLELQGDATSHLAELRDAQATRQAPGQLVTYAQVHDLSMYSSRVEGIGIEKPYYSPYIAKKKEGEGWFPENILPLISYTREGETEPQAVPATKAALEQLEKAVQKAEEIGKLDVELPWLPSPMPLSEAKSISETFKEVFADAGKPGFDPDAIKAKREEKLGAKKTLILRSNIQSVDYDEERREALLAYSDSPEPPIFLSTNYNLLRHQERGLAWLQHLYRSLAEHKVRGCVLADDMGLGKTFQLLAFMAWLVEKNPAIKPMLIVAPVSLLENWKEEAGKFVLPGKLPILTAYGDSLASLRVPREAVDSRLRTEDGLVRFLLPGWVGNAKIVLTTYETLRDLEFSFAAEQWSVMVCDEAQRIKNPAAMVTRAAKKQNVGFRVACTGTPVENTLADLWCLFDFVQPGLLGALNDFGQRYRKPIEARTDDEKARVEELRSRIAPQILRRMKSEVATDLPQKIIVDSCRQLTISTTQRNLYAGAIEDFKKRNDPNSRSPFKNHLGLLQYLRLVCTDPRRHGLTVFKPEPIDQYRAKAPKLDWLLAELGNIQKRGEKVIIFCEFRNIQRLLQHYISQLFGFQPDIINGDTSAAATNSASRQKRITAFQQKSGFGVIILSPVAVGFGVNIQAANHVIHYTRTWNPAKEDQATDRAYRIGQTKDVFVYYPVVRADDFPTFDVKLDELLTKKRDLASDMLNGSGDLSPGDFNIAEFVPEANISELEERVGLDEALPMDGRHFEGLAAELWSKQGFATYCTPASNDHGVDVVAIAGNQD